MLPSKTQHFQHIMGILYKADADPDPDLQKKGTPDL